MRCTVRFDPSDQYGNVMAVRRKRCDSTGEPVRCHQGGLRGHHPLLCGCPRFEGHHPRAYDTYGPDDPRRKLVNLLLGPSVGRTAAHVPGEQHIDLIHVDDVWMPILRAERLLAGRKGPWALCRDVGNFLRLKEIVALFEEAAGRKLNIQSASGLTGRGKL